MKGMAGNYRNFFVYAVQLAIYIHQPINLITVGQYTLVMPKEEVPHSYCHESCLVIAISWVF